MQVRVSLCRVCGAVGLFDQFVVLRIIYMVKIPSWVGCVQVQEIDGVIVVCCPAVADQLIGALAPLDRVHLCLHSVELDVDAQILF
jgi:hypothetical protein